MDERVKTIEQARSLPEIRYFDLAFGPLSGKGMEGDDIILFVDEDGRSMKVVETKDGWAKMPIYF